MMVDERGKREGDAKRGGETVENTLIHDNSTAKQSKAKQSSSKFKSACDRFNRYREGHSFERMRSTAE
jgi:hypothetical protein